MTHHKPMSTIRREYGQCKLSEENILDSPVAQFERWFEEELQIEQQDPTAMLLSTVDEQGRPDSRVVLLKGIDDEKFLFYTNYLSTKGKQILHNSHVALNFFWPKLVRQVRIRGQVTKTSQAQSEAYFSSRPLSSQFSAVISLQSTVVSSRQVLEEKLHQYIATHQAGEPVERPTYWGGYTVTPYEIEFWQGRDDRLHDRIQYVLIQGTWCHHRLAP